MLREIAHTRQHPGEPLRRWFTSETMDLVIWLNADNSLAAFQLCHDKPQAEKALSWSANYGLSAMRVDDGSSLLPGHKATPVLQADSRPDIKSALAAFRESCREVPALYADAIISQLNHHNSLKDT